MNELILVYRGLKMRDELFRSDTTKAAYEAALNAAKEG